MAEQEPDIHNFSTSSSNRLPTITGTQALQNELGRASGISTSLLSLDQLLRSGISSSSTPGIRRGHVTEIYGPPGVGKTTVGMQLAVNAIQTLDFDASAIWISTGKPLVRDRLDAIDSGLEMSEMDEPPSSPPQPGHQRQIIVERFLYIETLSLINLLTLLIHPTSVFPPTGTSLIVVDDLSNLINGSFPRLSRTKSTGAVSLQDKLAQKASTRRFQVMENLASGLTRLAASRHIAIVVLNSASTSSKDGQRALLKPALSGQAWEAAINTRILLYRDFCPPAQRNKLTARERKGYRLAAVVRLGGRDVFRRAVPFVIEESGLRELPLDIVEDGLDTEEQQVVDMNVEPPLLPPSDPPSDPPPFVTRSSPPLPSQKLPFQRASQLPHTDDGDPRRPTKRKANEIADSEDDDEAGAQESDHGQYQEDQDQDQDEILFDSHTRSVSHP